MRLSEIVKGPAVVVHFLRPEEIDADYGSLGFAVMEGSVAGVKTENELFSVVASAMQFPDYFGNNWDALYECLRDMGWMAADGYLLILRDASQGWTKNPYVLGRFVTVWLGASNGWAKNQKSFYLVFVM